MSKDLQVDGAAASVPRFPGRLALFGPPPLVEGENAAAYDELLAGISGAVRPRGILEEIWVRDVVDLVWEAFRLRRLKTNLMSAAAHEGLQRVLTPKLGSGWAADLAKRWRAGDAGAIRKINGLLEEAGLTIEAALAATLPVKLGDVERIERMTAAAEARRNATLREIERHRLGLAEVLRRAARQAEDAEFEVIEPGGRRLVRADAARRAPASGGRAAPMRARAPARRPPAARSVRPAMRCATG